MPQQKAANIMCTLSILQYASIKKGKIDRISIKRIYSGFMDPIKADDIYNVAIDLDEKYTLQETKDGSWAVGYAERGRNNISAVFKDVRDAACYLFWQMNNDTVIGTPWEYREEWEKATGMSY